MLEYSIFSSAAAIATSAAIGNSDWWIVPGKKPFNKLLRASVMSKPEAGLF
jgi:hypothetical protein